MAEAAAGVRQLRGSEEGQQEVQTDSPALWCAALAGSSMYHCDGSAVCHVWSTQV